MRIYHNRQVLDYRRISAVAIVYWESVKFWQTYEKVADAMQSVEQKRIWVISPNYRTLQWKGGTDSSWK